MKLFLLLLFGGFVVFSPVTAGEKDGNKNKQYQKDQKMGKMGICPVMGGNASRDISHTYKDKTYYFCCPMCIGKFKEDPEKYINKIKEIKLEAYQFGYSPERIVVNKGDIVRITAISRDVKHGLRIKDYDINIVVKKDESKMIEFIAKKEGKFDIICSVYCGKGHYKMKALLIVEESRDKEKEDSKKKK